MKKTNAWKPFIAVLLSLTLMLVSAAVLTGCNGDKVPDNVLKLEAEEAVIEGTPAAGGKSFIERANSKSDNKSSGDKFLSGLGVKDNKVSFVLSSTGGKTDMYLAVANGKAGADKFNAGDVFKITVNGSDFALPAAAIDAAGEYCDKWQTIKLADAELKSGFNTITLTITDDSNWINIDYLGVVPDKVGAEKHDHSWDMDAVSPTCTEGGTLTRFCKTCSIRYLYDTVEATGHSFGNYHYNAEATHNGKTGLMVRECGRCGEKEYSDVPSSYFGEVFEERDQFSTKKYETVYEAELANIQFPAGLNNGTSPIENRGDASGGKIVGNISNVGNYIEFTVNAAEACKADLVLVLANVLWTEQGIGILDPMSKYVSFTLKGETEEQDQKVDFSFVSFPGDENYNYYNWRYVVMKDIDLKEGSNVMVFKPEDNEDNVTIPNTDVMYIYTDKENIVSAKRTYDINNAEMDAAFVSDKAHAYEAVKTADKNEFVFNSNVVSTADIVVTVEGAAELASLGNALELTVFGKAVNLEDLPVVAGDGNKLIIKDVPVGVGAGAITFKANSSVNVKAVAVHMARENLVKLTASLDKEHYDYHAGKDTEGFTAPKLVFEAEDARFSVQDPGAHIKTPDDKSASGQKEADGVTEEGKDVESYGTPGNSLTWKINFGKAATADIAIRMACAKWDNETQSNSIMENLENYFTLTVDGRAVDMSQLTLGFDSATQWTTWDALVIKGLELSEGDHEIVMTCVSTAFPNTDVLYVYSASDAVITAVIPAPAPQPAPAE